METNTKHVSLEKVLSYNFESSKHKLIFLAAAARVDARGLCLISGSELMDITGIDAMTISAELDSVRDLYPWVKDLPAELPGIYYLFDFS